MTLFIKAIIMRILMNKIVKIILGNIFLLILFTALLFGTNYYLGAYKGIHSNIDIVSWYWGLGCAVIITSKFYDVGAWLFVQGTIASAWAVGLFQFFKFFHLDKAAEKSVIAAVVIQLIGYAIWKGSEFFEFKSKISTFKSLQEVDALGNGDTYEKGRQFEDFVAELYRGMGYSAMTTTEMRHNNMLPGNIHKRGGSGEQGVDVVLHHPRTGECILVQCKHYSNKVSNSAIQEIYTALPLYNGDRAIVVTNNYFTAPAIDLAASTKDKVTQKDKVTLVDRDELGRMIAFVNGKKSAA